MIPGYLWVYDHLLDLGLIAPSDEDKKAAYKTAQRDLAKQTKGMDFMQAKQLVEAIRQPKSQKVIIAAKNLLVVRYFKSLKDQGKHIKDVL